MQICCTKDLQKELGIAPEVGTEEKDLFCWSAHMITVNRRKTLVVVNDSNRFGFVLYGVNAKKMKNFKGLVLEGIRKSLSDQKLKQEVIEKYLEAAGEITFTRTRGPKYVSRLNKVSEISKIVNDRFNQTELYQTEIARIINNDLVKLDKKSDYEYPRDLLLRDIENLAGVNIIRCQSVNLIIKLNLERYIAWRRIITPVDVTFRQLHKQLQAAFDWMDYHLHCFEIIDETGKCIEVIISKDEEIYDSFRDCKLLLDTEVRLNDYLGKQYKIVYRYDYGDNWEHEITIGSIEEDYDKNYPVCLMGEGDAPPEDVGGVSGYIEFLNIISDPTHEEYKSMNEWAKSQGFKEFDIELLNRRLKSILNWG